MNNSGIRQVMLVVLVMSLAFAAGEATQARRARRRAMRNVQAAQTASGTSDAYILVKEDAALPLWGYQQLRMKDCAWCTRTVNLNRHHVIPQSANPALRDVKENLIVLCRDCHFVLGHRCNWKQYNPDVLFICTHFTNCIKSVDTRYAVTNEEWKAESGLTNGLGLVTLERPVSYFNGAADGITNVLGNVTNSLPENVREALERIRSSDK